MKIKLLLILFLAIGPLQSHAAEKYASPTGKTSNSGNSVAEAWPLAFALGASSPLNPGDSLLLADGVYPGSYVSELKGSPENPIVVLPMNVGKAVIDVGLNRSGVSGIRINGNNTWFIGIHVTSSSTLRKSDPSNGNSPVTYESGIAVFGDNNKLINCWVYDVVGGGLELWRTGLNLEVYGCVIFNNGSQDELRGTGHGMYIQHDDINAPKQIINNYVFQNASQGINIYTSNPENKGIIVNQNVAFNTGVMADYNPLFFRPPHNLTIGSKSNISSDMQVSGNFFYSDLQGGRLSANQTSNVTLGRTYSPNTTIKFTGNTVYGGRNQVEFLPVNRLEFKKNLIFNVNGNFLELLGENKTYNESSWNLNIYTNLSKNNKAFDGLSYDDWRDTSQFDRNSKLYDYSPQDAEILIVKNKYVPNLYYVTILNLKGDESVSVDFTEYGIVAGQGYKIIDVQNPFDKEQTVVGTTSNSLISFPMTWTKSLQPKGNMPHQVKHTDKTFGTFILEVTEPKEVKRPQIKDFVTLYLGVNGKATLTSPDFLETGSSSGFSFATGPEGEFSCNEIGGSAAAVTTTNTLSGEQWIDKIKVEVLDTLAPQLEVKNAAVTVDPATGSINLDQSLFVKAISDNCGVKELKINTKSVACEEVRKEISVLIQAIDNSGNMTELSVKLKVTSETTKPVTISGLPVICADESQVLELKSEAQFEVVEWRKNGTVISNSTAKKLEIGAAGSYHALIRYVGGCLQETAAFEVKDAPAPAGEIVMEGNILKAPLGEYTYQWFFDESKLEGANQSTFTVNQPGEYSVELTTNAGCKTRLEPVTMTISGILNPGHLISEDFKIYPNPVTDEVMIEVSGDHELKKDTWQLYDENGKAVGSQVILIRHTTSLLQLNISQLASGTYVVMGQSTNQELFIGKILKVD